MSLSIAAAFAALRRFFDPPPMEVARKVALASREVCERAEEYGQHADVLSDFVHNVRRAKMVPKKSSRAKRASAPPQP